MGISFLFDGMTMVEEAPRYHYRYAAHFHYAALLYVMTAPNEIQLSHPIWQPHTVNVTSGHHH